MIELTKRHDEMVALDGLSLEVRPGRVLGFLASADDLIVVGSRGPHGPRALGSVSERVAHQAPCSVLVVRQLHSQEAEQ